MALRYLKNCSRMQRSKKHTHRLPTCREGVRHEEEEDAEKGGWLTSQGSLDTK